MQGNFSILSNITFKIKQFYFKFCSLTFLGKAGVYGILKIKLFKLLRRLNNGL